MNALLKKKVDYRKNELPVFIDELKAAIEEQERELERAVIKRGKYQLCPAYKHDLQKDEHEWFIKMTVNQRKSHLKKVAAYSLNKKPGCRRLLFDNLLQMTFVMMYLHLHLCFHLQ